MCIDAGPLGWQEGSGSEGRETVPKTGRKTTPRTTDQQDDRHNKETQRTKPDRRREDRYILCRCLVTMLRATVMTRKNKQAHIPNNNNDKLIWQAHGQVHKHGVEALLLPEFGRGRGACGRGNSVSTGWLTDWLTGCLAAWEAGWAAGWLRGWVTAWGSIPSRGHGNGAVKFGGGRAQDRRGASCSRHHRFYCCCCCWLWWKWWCGTNTKEQRANNKQQTTQNTQNNSVTNNAQH